METITTAQLLAIPNGNAGTLETLKKMRLLIISEVSNYRIIQLARYLVEDLKQQDFLGEAKLIQEFVRDQIRYVKDPRNVELIQTPTKTLEIGQGDCDDKSILVSTLLECLGMPTRLAAVGFNNSDFCSHVLVEVYINRQWHYVETTEPVLFGWTPPNITRKMVIAI